MYTFFSCLYITLCASITNRLHVVTQPRTLPADKVLNFDCEQASRPDLCLHICIYPAPSYASLPPSSLSLSLSRSLARSLARARALSLSLTHTHTRTQVLVSIQGLVLVSEPYYNEAGYEKQMGTLEGRHNSKQVSLPLSLSLSDSLSLSPSLYLALSFSLSLSDSLSPTDHERHTDALFCTRRCVCMGTRRARACVSCAWSKSSDGGRGG